MVGILILTHGKLAEELINSVESVTGKQDNIMSICMFSGDDLEKKSLELEEKINAVNKGKGVIIFTDMFGGTPSNLAMSALVAGDIEVIAGVNLPMLVKAVQDRAVSELQVLIENSMEAGKKYISLASSLLK